MKTPKIEILPGHRNRLLSGYPWVYSNEILQSNKTKCIPMGDMADLVHQGKTIARGYYNRHSLIAFRVLSHDPNEEIDVEFFKRRFSQALALRERFYDKPYYRLIHAEADGLPGLIIDRFDNIYVIQINTQGMNKLKPILIEALKELFQPQTLYFKNDSSYREIENLPNAEPEIIGKDIYDLNILENDTSFFVTLLMGQKTGWFYDHRENRDMIAKLAKDKTVIDYFCYSGGFAIQAAKQGAAKVIGVDRSESAIKNAIRTAALNKVEKQCEFIVDECFDDMDKRISEQQTFDIVILDPPAFVKAKKDLAAGLKGYEKLIHKGIQLTAPGGLLLIASCSYHVKEVDLKNCLSTALGKQRRQGKIQKRLGAGFDHPLHPLLEESEYLKGFLVSL